MTKTLTTGPLVTKNQTTTSIIVAQCAGMEHHNILRVIRNLGCSPRFTALNFKASEYKDPTGRTLPMYEMTRDGCARLLMSLTTRKANAWKEEFIEAFTAMESLCKHLTDPLWLTCRDRTKQAHREFTDSIKVFVEYAESQGSSNAKRYYSNIAMMINKALFPGRYSTNIAGDFRDTLSRPELEYLASAEHVAAKALDEGIQEGLPYKDIYSRAKDRIQMFAQSHKLTYQEFNLGAPTLELPFAPAEDF